MAEEQKLIILILFMTLVTYLPRALPLQIDQKYWPQWLKNSLDVLPVAVIAAITVPNIILNSYAAYFLTAEFITTIFAIIVAFQSKNLILTIAVSLIFFFIVEHYFFKI